jgi:hypothetical protein
MADTGMCQHHPTSRSEQKSNELRTLNLVVGGEQCRKECPACARRLQIGSLDQDIAGIDVATRASALL